MKNLFVIEIDIFNCNYCHINFSILLSKVGCPNIKSCYRILIALHLTVTMYNRMKFRSFQYTRETNLVRVSVGDEFPWKLQDSYHFPNTSHLMTSCCLLNICLPFRFSEISKMSPSQIFWSRFQSYEVMCSCNLIIWSDLNTWMIQMYVKHCDI